MNRDMRTAILLVPPSAHGTGAYLSRTDVGAVTIQTDGANRMDFRQVVVVREDNKKENIQTDRFNKTHTGMLVFQYIRMYNM